jgi:hypothetical protein
LGEQPNLPEGLGIILILVALGLLSLAGRGAKRVNVAREPLS